MSFRQNMGCSAILASVAFLIGFLVSLFAREITWPERLFVAIIPAFCTFLAACLLFLRDDVRTRRTMRMVRLQLLAEPDIPIEAFVAALPTDDSLLLRDLRTAIAKFFDVPTTKVPRSLDLKQDLRVDDLQPAFQFAVVNPLVKTRTGDPDVSGLSMLGLKTIDDLAATIQEVIDARFGTRDLDFGVMHFNGIDAWDCSAIVELPHPLTRYFAIHIWCDEEGPTEFHRQRIRWLKVAYDNLWPQIVESICRLHPDLKTVEDVTAVMPSWIGVHLGEHGNESIELVYHLHLPNDGTEAIFVTVSESGVGDVVVAS